MGCLGHWKFPVAEAHWRVGKGRGKGGGEGVRGGEVCKPLLGDGN